MNNNSRPKASSQAEHKKKFASEKFDIMTCLNVEAMIAFAVLAALGLAGSLLTIR